MPDQRLERTRQAYRETLEEATQRLWRGGGALEVLCWPSPTDRLHVWDGAQMRRVTCDDEGNEV